MVPIIDFRTIGVMYSYWLLCTLTVTIAWLLICFLMIFICVRHMFSFFLQFISWAVLAFHSFESVYMDIKSFIFMMQIHIRFQYFSEFSVVRCFTRRRLEISRPLTCLVYVLMFGLYFLHTHVLLVAKKPWYHDKQPQVNEIHQKDAAALCPEGAQIWCGLVLGEWKGHCPPP